MITYIIRRLLLAIPSLLAISILVFLMVRLVPGDPAAAMLGQYATEERVAEVRAALGLDQPLHVQYARWLGHALQGDFGRSIRSRRPVTEDILQRLPATLELALVGLFLAITAGIPMGVIAATRRNSVFDRISMVGTVIGQSMPIFWLGIILIYIFSYALGLLPFSGRLDREVNLQPQTGFYILDSILHSNWGALRNALAHLILPAIALASVSLALIGRITRSSMLEVLGQNYIRTARYKGLEERVVTYRHAFRNAMIPLVTVVGLQLGTLLGGAILTETVFAWPGLGRLIVNAVFNRDYPLVQGCVLFIAIGFLLTNLVVDVLYAIIDPRVTYE
ncbi:MAG: ABC transporter permease [Anaerolineae bacterium]|jgi:peptide/nickel transport system permease protein